jgi:hypothetical protein
MVDTPRAYPPRADLALADFSDKARRDRHDPFARLIPGNETL